MRLSEDRIRRIVREEAQRVLREGAAGMSILPPDVPVDLYVGCFRRRVGVLHPNWVSAFTPANRERHVGLGVASELSQEEAEELADLGIMCVGPGEVFPFGIERAPVAVVESLGYDPRRARNLIDSMRGDLYERMGKSASLSIFYDLHHGHAAGEFNRQYNRPRGLRPEIEALRAVDRADLERGIEMMDSLYDFTERVKGAPKSTRQKLMRMIGPDGSGLMQAVEIASTIL
jgi:hypothetical protein